MTKSSAAKKRDKPEGVYRDGGLEGGWMDTGSVACHFQSRLSIDPAVLLQKRPVHLSVCPACCALGRPHQVPAMRSSAAGLGCSSTAQGKSKGTWPEQNPVL